MVRRVAIQISGQVRPCWKEVYDMWTNYKEIAPEGIEVDFFLATWDNDNYQGGGDLFTEERIDKLPDNYYDVESIVKYYDRWGRVNTLRRQYEYDNNIKYDLVLQVRPDYYIRKFWKAIYKINADIINDTNPQAVLNDNILYSTSVIEVHKIEGGPQWQGYHFIDDKIFMGTPAAINYLTNFSVEFHRGDEQRKYPLTYHVGLAHWLLDGRLVVQVLKDLKGGLSRDFDSFTDYMNSK